MRLPVVASPVEMHDVASDALPSFGPNYEIKFGAKYQIPKKKKKKNLKISSFGVQIIQNLPYWPRWISKQDQFSGPSWTPLTLNWEAS